MKYKLLLLATLFLCYNSYETHAQALTIPDSMIDLKLPDSLGKWQTLKQFENDLVIVDFWSSSCAPCRKYNNPWLAKMWNLYGDKGLKIYSVSIDRDYHTWVNAARTDGLGGTLVNDAFGFTGKSLKAYNVNGIPTKFLFYKGKLLLQDSRMDDYEAEIKKILQLK
jgi:thiol-disulfide isomerase/thioredoxin